MKLLVLIAVFLLFSFSSVFGQLLYPADSISPDLRSGARAVVRSSQTKVTVLSEKKGVLSYKTAITLLNENAEDLTIVEIPYSEHRKISNIKATAYNEKGKMIWTLKSLDIRDMKDFSGPEVLDKDRKKIFEIPTFSFPFTIEYSFDLHMEDLFLSPQYYMQTDPDIAIENAGLQYIIPVKIGFNFKSLYLSSPTDSIRKGDRIYMSWVEENLPAKRQMMYSPSVIKKMPLILATPVHTDLQGYKGSFASWHDYGIWIADLLRGRDELEPQYIETARNLVKDISDRRDKVRVLYEYMQKNTRYFLINFGIGGKQPIPANEVARYGYGDCKALSNYMKALLKAVDIESYYTLVRAGDNVDIEYDFPCNQFNHAILCIPDKNDTIWLECTDQTSPFNYLGSFTCDRHVLLVTSEGGKIVKTPDYGRDFNTINTFSEIRIYGSGDADVKLEFYHSGLQYDELFGVSESKEDQRKLWLASQFDHAAFEIVSETFSFDKSKPIPSGVAQFELNIRDLAARSKERLYVSPCFIEVAPFIWNDPGEIEIDQAFMRNDSIKIEVPVGYRIESIPEKVDLRTKFGEYSCQTSISNNYVYFVRKFSVNKAVYSTEAFQEFYDFLTSIAMAEEKMLVMKSL